VAVVAGWLSVQDVVTCLLVGVTVIVGWWVEAALSAGRDD